MFHVVAETTRIKELTLLAHELTLAIIVDARGRFALNSLSLLH